MTARNPRLPVLPGYATNSQLGKKNFGLRPIFTIVDGVNMLVDKYEGTNRVPSMYARRQAPDLPTWLVYDKSILRFNAYFQQTLQEMQPSHLVRKVEILFYLEDGTIKVTEPRTTNSGMQQGMLISRQRIRLPESYDYYYDVPDLNIGLTVELFGKVFKIVNCDNFTRVFLNRLGIHVPDPIPFPDAVVKMPQHPKPAKRWPFKQFLDFDRQVLRFFGYWDDRDSDFGKIHNLEIHYFLADDTIEIKENLPANSGSEVNPMFLKRMRLPKKEPLRVEMTGAPPPPALGPADLSVGATLDVFGRRVLLTDCDPFTKEYYRLTYGLDTFTPLPMPDDGGADCVSHAPPAERELPPWNGYGSYEDSAGNCRSVEPKPPRRDFIKFLHRDKDGFDSRILRFAARLINDNPEDAKRYFIVKYYLCDDTMAVFELAERNSGFKGGSFFSRDKMYCPDAAMFAANEPPSYGQRDMWVGNELYINRHRFRLVAADEYALRYMELHPDEFPMANVAVIIDKIRRTLAMQENGYKNFVAKYMTAVLPDQKEIMSVQCFKQALKELMCEKMTEHEYLSLIRFFRADRGHQDRPRRDMIRSLVFTELTRGLWDERARLREGLLHADAGARGALSPRRLRQLLRAHRLPLGPELIDCMLAELRKDEDCNIIYADLMEFLDFKTGHVMTSVTTEDYTKVVRHAPPLKNIECLLWHDADTLIREGYVHWNAFICKLNLEHLVKEQT